MTEDKSNRLQIYIILFNCKEDVKTYEEIYQKELEAISFGEIIEKRFKNLIQRNGSHLSIMASGYKIYCGTETGQTISREIDIYGESGLYKFIALAKENDWKIYDKSSNDFIDLNFPERYSYLEYKALKRKKLMRGS